MPSDLEGQRGLARARRVTVARLVLPLLLAASLVLPASGARAQDGCRLPSDDQYEAGGALEGVMLALHGLQDSIVPLEHALAFGDPGPCPGGSRDAFRGVDIMGWVLEVSGPAMPDVCSPDDPPTFELPLRSTRCVDPTTTVASRTARVPYGELISRTPLVLLLPTVLPDGLVPHWSTFRVTDFQVGSGIPRLYGTVVRYRGDEETPWLVLLEASGTRGDWLLDELRAQSPVVPVRNTTALVLDGLPEYEGPGNGLLWEEGGVRVVLFGSYPVDALVRIAEAMSLQTVARAPRAEGGR